MSESSQEGRYAPPGPPPIVFEGFSTLNTQSARPSIDDDQCSWMDGFMPIGKGTARTMPGIGAPILTGGPGSVVWFDFVNIGFTPYCIVMKSDGSVVAVNTDTLSFNVITPAGTITNPSKTQSGISQWGAQFLILVAAQPNGYFLWDGTTFYSPGDSVPGFTTVPTGVGGTSAEVYESRVWVTNGPTVQFSAPQSITDFATGDGGGTFQSTDSFLKAAFIQGRQTNGFLYLIADSSINYISGVTTSGSPPDTTFSNQNADPETGTTWPGTIDVFSRNIVFANEFGAHISYGGAVTKISDALDGIYSSGFFLAGAIVPSACKAIVYSKRIWAVLIPIIDPITNQQTNKLFCWDGKKWWSTSQDVPLIYVQHQELASVLFAYGTDGANIYPLFTTPSTAFTKTIQSKLFDKPGGWGFLKSADRLWGVVQYNSNEAPALTISIDNENGSSAAPVTVTPNVATWFTQGGLGVSWVTLTGQPVQWFTSGGFVTIPPTAIAQNGVLLGFTLKTNAADMSLLGLSMSPQIPQYRG